MNNSRTKNAVRNIFSGFFNRIIMMVFLFIIRTVIIKTLGSEYLGINSLFTSILQVLNLAELGFSSAIVYSMYKPIAEKDNKTICALMNLYKKIYTIIGIVILTVGICIMPFLKYLIKGSYPADINLYVVFALYLINTSFTYFLFAYKSAILVANQRSDITNNVLTFTSLIQYILQIIVLFITRNYYMFMIANIITTALNNIIVAIIAKKQYPEISCQGEVNEEIKKDLKKRTSGLMINKICQTTRNSLDSIFISAFLGLNMVAIYNNYYTIMSAVVNVFGIMINAIIAGVGNSIVTESKEKNYKDMNKFNFMYMWLVGLSTICLLCLYQPFMKVWMGDSMLLPFGMVILFCIYFYALKMGDIRAVYSDAKGLWWENRYRAIAESIANVVLNFVLGKIWGIYGIIIATLISLVIINYIYGSQILFKYYFTQVSVKDFFKRHIEYIITTVAIAVITYYICNKILLNGILEIIVKLCICLIIPNIFYYLIYSKTKIFKESNEFVKDNIINKKESKNEDFISK